MVVGDPKSLPECLDDSDDDFAGYLNMLVPSINDPLPPLQLQRVVPYFPPCVPCQLTVAAPSWCLKHVFDSSRIAQSKIARLGITVDVGSPLEPCTFDPFWTLFWPNNAHYDSVTSCAHVLGKHIWRKTSVGCNTRHTRCEIKSSRLSFHTVNMPWGTCKKYPKDASRAPCSKFLSGGGANGGTQLGGAGKRTVNRAQGRVACGFPYSGVCGPVHQRIFT